MFATLPSSGCPRCLKPKDNTDTVSSQLADLTSDVVQLKAHQTSYAQAVATGTVNTKTKNGVNVSDRKFNLIIFGIDEHDNGTPRYKRLQKDLETGAAILFSINPTVTENCVSDSFRLGRFNKDSKRPLLLKLTRRSDVNLILSNRANLSSHSPGIYIKPDLSPEERTIQSTLLRVRWSLINDGNARESIKIRGNTIYLRGKKHGSVVNSVFQENTPSTTIQTIPDHNLDQSNIAAPPESNTAAPPESNTSQSSD